MKDRSDPRLVKRLSVFASATAVFSAVVGLSGLAGWTLHIASLETWGAAPVTMKANTAVCFVLTGVSLWLLRKKDNQSFGWAKKLAAKTLATMVGLVALLSLAEHLFRRDFGIDQFLLAAPPALETASVRTGLMSPITAGAFLLLALALLVIDWRTRRGRWPAQPLSLSAGTAATFGILSFAFDPHIYAAHLSLALPTAVTLAVLSLGLVCARTEWGLGALLCSQSLGGSLARRLLPAAFIPVLVGWIRWQITATGLYSEWSIVVLASLTTMSLLAGIIAWAAVAVDRNDVERRRVEEALHVSEEQLNRLLDRLDEPQTEALLRRKVIGGFVAAVLMTSFLGFLSWYSARRAEEDSDWVTHTQVVLKTLDATVGHLVDVETGARGFALSGHDLFLEPYETGKRVVGPDLDTLRHLTADNPNQQRRLEALGPQVNAKIAASDRLVAAQRQMGAAPTLNQLLQGKQLMDAVRTTIQQMEDEEERLLDQRAQKTHSARRLTISVMVLGSLVAMAFLVIAGFAIGRQINISSRARAQLKSLNARLEERVVERTAALGESEGRLAGVIQLAMDSIITVDEEQRIVLFNSAAERIFRCPAAEALGQSLTRFIPQRFHGAHAGHIRKFGETGVTNRAMGAMNALWAVRADGQEFQIEASISQVVTGGKKLFTVILRDVTERVQVEQALREQAEMLDSAQVFVRDMESRIVFWPRGAEKLYGFSSQEALGILSHDLFHTQFPEPLQTVEKKLFKTGMWEGELVHRKRDGSIIVVASAWALHRDRQGQPIRILETNTDITARKRAEEQLSRQAEELTRSQQALKVQTALLQSVLDSMGEGLVAADEQGKFTLWNPAAEKILGLGVAKISSQEWSEHYGIFLPDTLTPFPPDQLPLARAIRGETCTAEMFARNAALAEGAWIEASGHPLKDANGAHHGGVVAFRDITHKKKAEQEIHKLNEALEQRVLERTAQLESANKELEAFTYSVSHDLRAPLRHISGFSKLLVEEFGPGLDPGAQQYLQRIEDGAHRMGLLVDELLNLAKVGRHALTLQVTGLNSVVQEVVTMLMPESEGRQVEWKIADLPFVECDPVLVKQVLQNLLANALKFTRPREFAVIEINHREENGQKVIVIRDNGVGFSMKYTDKLFGVFQRLHRTEDFEGTGIGLATVHRIIQKHGGRVWAEAELDRGATFCFTLGAQEQTEVKNKTTAAGAQI